MSSYSQGNRFFINEFDESLDQIILDVVECIYSSNDKRLEFWINSEGGDATRAFALVELMERAKARGVTVATYVLHEANSSGSIVAVAGSRGHRKVAKRGGYLLHYGEAEVVATGPVELSRIFEANRLHFNNIRNHYLENTKAGDAAIDSFLNNDNYYMQAEQAISLGLADKYL